jgi:RNA polymerase sigma-70 factor (ECF subfamily)
MQDIWFRVCRGMLKDADLARDATQETAFRFLRDLPRFRGDSAIRTWSIGIALNVAREMRRTSYRSEMSARDARLDASTRAPRSPDDSAAASEESEHVRELLDGLPDRQREALILRYFEGLSVEEAAAAMSCAAGTVKATVHQALRALKNRLKQLS